MNPPTLRFLRSLCGWPEVVGIAAGSLSWLFWPLAELFHGGPGWILLALALLASIAGFGAALGHAVGGNLPAHAVRAGAIAALCAAAVGVFGLTWASRSQLPAFAATRVMVTGLLSILPACFFGTVVAGIAALAFAQPPAPVKPLPEPGKAALWLSRLLVAFLVGQAVLLPFRPKRPSRVESPTLATRVQAPTPVPVAEAPFSYQVPAEIGNAEAVQWRFEKSRELPPPSDTCAPALSPDGRYIAYVPGTQEARALKVFDLHSNAVPHSIWLPAPLAHLVFSPNGRRLFAVTAERPTRIAVIDLSRDAYIPLPQPKNRQLPEGPVWWWQPSLIGFFPKNQPPFLLDLETLILAPASSVPDWQKLNNIERDHILQSANRTGMPGSRRWYFDTVKQWLSAELPEVEQSQSWPVSLEERIAILASDHAYSHGFPPIATGRFKEVLGARDGSKVVGVSDTAVVAFYFGLRPAPRLRWTVEGLPSLQNQNFTTDVKDALEGGQLGAIVYAPLVNPLNNKTVGPDRHQTRGRVLFESWEGNSAKIWLAEEWADVQPGDVVADPHEYLKDQAPRLFRFDPDQRWWALLSESPELTEQIPTRGSIEEKRGAFIAAKEAEDRAKAEITRVKPAPVPEPSGPPVMLPPTARDERPSGIAADLMNFLRTHHERATQSDLDGMAADYASVVDYFDHGLVPRSFIIDDSAKYRQRIQVIRESVVGDISIEDLGSAGWQVAYLLNVEGSTLYPPAGKPTGGDFIVTLKIKRAGNSFEIYHHRAKRVAPRN